MIVIISFPLILITEIPYLGTTAPPQQVRVPCIVGHLGTAYK